MNFVRFFVDKTQKNSYLVFNKPGQCPKGETMKMLMNIHTGSVAPESEWREDFAKMTPDEWGGENPEGGDLVEVIANIKGQPGYEPRYGEWREAE